MAEDDRPRPQLHAYADIGGRVHDRRSRLTPLADAAGDGMARPRPSEAQHIGSVEDGHVVHSPDLGHAPSHEATQVEVRVIKDPYHLIGRPDGVNCFHGLEYVAGMPAASDEHKGKPCHVTAPA